MSKEVIFISVENKRLHTALIGSYSAHKKCCFSEFSKLDLTTGQPKVLFILFQNEGYLQKDLARRCRVEPATMTSLLSNMIKRGLIHKKIVYVSGGKRAYSVYLTESGRNMAIKVNKIVDDMEKISFRGFSDFDKQILLDLLNRIEYNLNHKANY